MKMADIDSALPVYGGRSNMKSHKSAMYRFTSYHG